MTDGHTGPADILRDLALAASLAVVRRRGLEYGKARRRRAPAPACRTTGRNPLETDVRMLQGVKNVVPPTIRDRAHLLRIRTRTSHLCGPKRWETDPESMVVSCLVKNGGYYVKEFVRHYQAMGASHIVVLDNGSTDDTVERFAVHDGVTVYRCELPVGRYQHLMKRAAATQLVGRGWCLDVDIDEFFDYPFSARMPLKDFIRYSDDSGFDAVVTQMVDMYSAEPIGYLAEAGTIFRPSDYPYYDLAEIAHESYRDAEIVRAKASANLVDGPDPGTTGGGVRHRLFQLRCLLTKHSMFRVDRDLRLFTHPHFCDGAKLADVSGILRHYKLVSNCYETSTLNRVCSSPPARAMPTSWR